MWRYWRALPANGRIGILFGSWYSDPIIGRVTGDFKTSELDHQIDEIVRFEKMLAHDGVVLLKFWFHLSKEKQKNRLKQLEKDPKTRWRVTDQDWENFKHYDKYIEFLSMCYAKPVQAKRRGWWLRVKMQITAV